MPPRDDEQDALTSGNQVLHDAHLELERLHAEIDQCTRCASEVGPGYQKITGLRRGAPSKIMVVGQGPGRNESEHQRAFAGPAGVRLDQWLIASGAHPEDPRRDVYSTSLIKCLAPERQAAYDRMVRNCRGFLNGQIAILRPRLIITLGSPAYTWLGNADESYPDALCKLQRSSTDPLLSRHGYEYMMMPWPHPSPSNNGILMDPAIITRMEASFQLLRPYFERR